MQTNLGENSENWPKVFSLSKTVTVQMQISRVAYLLFIYVQNEVLFISFATFSG